MLAALNAADRESYREGYEHGWREAARRWRLRVGDGIAEEGSWARCAQDDSAYKRGREAGELAAIEAGALKAEACLCACSGPPRVQLQPISLSELKRSAPSVDTGYYTERTERLGEESTELYVATVSCCGGRVLKVYGIWHWQPCAGPEVAVLMCPIVMEGEKTLLRFEVPDSRMPWEQQAVHEMPPQVLVDLRRGRNLVLWCQAIPRSEGKLPCVRAIDESMRTVLQMKVPEGEEVLWFSWIIHEDVDDGAGFHLNAGGYTTGENWPIWFDRDGKEVRQIDVPVRLGAVESGRPKTLQEAEVVWRSAVGNGRVTKDSSERGHDALRQWLANATVPELCRLAEEVAQARTPAEQKVASRVEQHIVGRAVEFAGKEDMVEILRHVCPATVDGRWLEYRLQLSRYEAVEVLAAVYASNASEKIRATAVQALERALPQVPRRELSEAAFAEECLKYYRGHRATLRLNPGYRRPRRVSPFLVDPTTRPAPVPEGLFLEQPADTRPATGAAAHAGEPVGGPVGAPAGAATARPFRVVARDSAGAVVSLQMDAGGDSDLAILKGQDSLQEIALVGDAPRFTMEGWKQLSGLPRLESIDLHCVSRPDGILPMLSDVPHLARLRADLADEQLRLIGHLPRLQSLDLQRSSLTGAGLAHLKELGSLRELDLSYTGLTDAGAAEGLAELPNLAVLRLRATAAGDATAAVLGQMAGLRELELGGTRTTSAGVQRLAALRALERLELSSCAIGDEALRDIAGMKKLRILRLDSTRVTDAGLVHLKALPALESLFLSHTPVTDQGLQALAEMRSLRRVDLKGTRASDAGIAHLRRARPEVEVVD